jgi:membrane dipeptidase
VCAHIRNIRDEQIRACAAGDGVIGIVGIGAFVGDPQARSESLFRHIDHISTLVGARHVGLGTDYVPCMQELWTSIRAAKDSSWPDPTGTQLYEGECVQPEQLPELVEIMLAHGYSAQDVKGILGANFRRVYAAAEGACDARVQSAP